MKAIRVHHFGDPSVLKLEDVPDPRPSVGQVVVRVHAAGVNPVETYVRSGRYAAKGFPYTPGSDAGGVVEAVGENVRKVKVGDRVYTSSSLTGTYAQKALCEETHVHPLPGHVAFAQGAAIGVPYATAYRALFQRGQAKAGETVLVHGASGGVGVAAVQLARHAGLRVIGTAGTERGRNLVLKQGAHHILDHHDAQFTEKVMDLTNGAGPGIILEMLANVNLDKDLTLIAKGGRVIVIGNRGRIEIDPRQTMAKDADIRGMLLFATPPSDLAQIHAALVAGLDNKTLNPVVGTELPLAEAPKAHELVMRPGSYGKIVLVN